MDARSAASLLLLAMLAGTAAPALAQGPHGPGGRELIYCADLMSHEEREAYRAKMRAAPTEQEKAALREAHKRDMQARATARGNAALCEPVRLRWRGGREQ